MIVEDIIKIYKAEIKYLDEYYSSKSFISYLEELNWIEKELLKHSHAAHYIKSLERIRQHILNRVRKCIDTNGNKVQLQQYIDELALAHLTSKIEAV